MFFSNFFIKKNKQTTLFSLSHPSSPKWIDCMGSNVRIMKKNKSSIFYFKALLWRNWISFPNFFKSAPLSPHHGLPCPVGLLPKPFSLTRLTREEAQTHTPWPWLPGAMATVLPHCVRVLCAAAINLPLPLNALRDNRVLEKGWEVKQRLSWNLPPSLTSEFRRPVFPQAFLH